MTNAVFVTGTDTGIGKTVISSAIALGIRMEGIDCGVMKPVQCAGDDASVLKKVSHTDDSLELINPYYFSRPLSPHLAAKLEKRRISVERIVKSYDSLRKKHQFLVVEGAGGLLVPLKNNFLVADLIQELDIPTIIVARLSLGTINHSLLTIEAARNRGIKVIGIIFNQSEKGSLAICEKTNPQIISKLSRIKVMGVIPYLESLNKRNDSLKGLRETAKRIDITSILKY
ncbi:MAG: dethiobiotin synthase [Candidatus Anammoxibacter sp.]